MPWPPAACPKSTGAPIIPHSPLLHTHTPFPPAGQHPGIRRLCAVQDDQPASAGGHDACGQGPRPHGECARAELAATSAMAPMQHCMLHTPKPHSVAKRFCMRGAHARGRRACIEEAGKLPVLAASGPACCFHAPLSRLPLQPAPAPLQPPPHCLPQPASRHTRFPRSPSPLPLSQPTPPPPNPPAWTRFGGPNRGV